MLRILRQGEDRSNYAERLLQEKIYEDIAILRMSLLARLGDVSEH